MDRLPVVSAKAWLNGSVRYVAFSRQDWKGITKEIKTMSSFYCLAFGRRSLHTTCAKCATCLLPSPLREFQKWKILFWDLLRAGAFVGVVQILLTEFLPFQNVRNLYLVNGRSSTTRTRRQAQREEIHAVFGVLVDCCVNNTLHHHRDASPVT